MTEYGRGKVAVDIGIQGLRSSVCNIFHVY